MRAYKSFLIAVCAVGVISVGNAQKQSGILRVDPPHGDASKLPNLCADCHFGYGAPNPSPTINDKCLSCHNGIAAPAAETHRGVSCTVCHNPHHQEQERENASTYSKLVKTTIGQRPVKLMRSTGANSFADGDGVYDGVCEVCHTTTRYHRNNGTGLPHNNAANCIACHPHNVGFSGAAGGPACLQCHQNPMGSRRAVGSDFTSSQPHHPLTYNSGGNLNTPADNNCLICHDDYPNLHANGVVDLNPDPDNSGSQEWNGVYADAWCMDCHDGNNPDPNYRLGGIVGPDKQTFYAAQNVHGNGVGFSGRCSDCHSQTNQHMAPIKFYSNFYLDDKEENMCFGCHGGAANVNNAGRYMENIRVAYTTGNINTRSKHVNGGSVNIGDGLVFCRNCHDPHQLNHATNLLIDPQNRTQPWTGTMRDYCFRCHDGSAIPNHQIHMELINANACSSCHNTGGGSDPACTDCHQSHGSTLHSLAYINIAGKTMSVSPPSATLTIGGLQYFNAILNPPFTQFSQNLVNKLSRWSSVTTSGGSVGTEYMRTHYIPLDRTIGYDPNANGGWGLITVTSAINISSTTTIEDLNVYVDIQHHYRGDIELDLTHTQSGKTVRVQALDWSDWQSNLVFWYDTESPNPAHGNASPRSTAESLTAFDGESISGEWILTIRDTWPSDNPTDPSAPDFCKVNSWGMSINGGVLVSLSSTPGLAIGLYEGTGLLYSTLQNGKLVPAQSGLDVSVSENPPPLQATASLTVMSLTGTPLVTRQRVPSEVPLVMSKASPRAMHRPRILMAPLEVRRSVSSPANLTRTHSTLGGTQCSSCHGTRRN